MEMKSLEKINLIQDQFKCSLLLGSSSCSTSSSSTWNMFLFPCSSLKSGCGTSKMKIILSSSESFQTQCSKESSKISTSLSAQLTRVPPTSIPQPSFGIFSPRCNLSLELVGPQ